MAGPLFAGVILSQGLGWRTVYRWTSAFAIILGVRWLLVRSPAKREKIRRGMNGLARPILAELRAGGSAGLIRISLAAVFYAGAEIGLASWLSEYIQASYGFSVIRGSTYITVFFALLTVGRLMGSLVVDRLGYMKTLLWVIAGTVLALSIGLFFSGTLSIFIALSGMFFGPVFPTVTALAADHSPSNMSVAFGVVFFFAGLGGMAGPRVIGLVADATSINASFAFTLVFLLFCAATLIVIKPRDRRAHAPSESQAT